jgi:hypothetical protein
MKWPCSHTFCLATSVNVGLIFLNIPPWHYDFENSRLKESNFSVNQVLIFKILFSDPYWVSICWNQGLLPEIDKTLSHIGYKCKLREKNCRKLEWKCTVYQGVPCTDIRVLVTVAIWAVWGGFLCFWISSVWLTFPKHCTLIAVKILLWINSLRWMVMFDMYENSAAAGMSPTLLLFSSHVWLVPE